jgi:hypothetical protein
LGKGEKMINSKDVTIIVPHLGGTPKSEKAFVECISSLTQNSSDIKLITVRNGDKCTEHRSDIKILSQGQCMAVNAAISIVNTPWVFITNDDMVYAPFWFDRLTDFSLTNKDIYCVSPILIERKSGAPTFIVEDFGNNSENFNEEEWLEFSKNYKGQGIRTGFNFPLLIKKEIWDLVGGYDINYDPWGSNGDSDLEYKIKLIGVQPYQNTNCPVYHFSQTSGTFHPDNQSYWQKNYDYFIEKWGFPRSDNGIWEANFKIPEPPIRKFEPWWEKFYGEY